MWIDYSIKCTEAPLGFRGLAGEMMIGDRSVGRELR